MIQLIDTHRAIAVIMAMGKDRGKEFIRNFQPEELRHMAQCARNMSRLTEDDLKQVVGDFENMFVTGAGIDELDTRVAEMLANSFGEEGLVNLLGKNDNDNASIWNKLASVDADGLSEFLTEESDLVTAYVLSRLPDQNVARQLLMLDREKRSAVIGFMIAAKPPSDAVVALIEDRLRETFGSDDSGGGGERSRMVAAALNEFDRAELDELMDDLKGLVPPKRLAEVRSHLFRFEDLPLLDQAALSAIFDSMPQDLLTIALKGVNEQTREAVLGAVGQRNRRMIEAELASPKPIPETEIVSARRKIVADVLRRAQNGEFSLPSAEN